MYNWKSILAIIPARWGSKWIKNKNIIDLYWKPLICYSIEIALKIDIIDKIVVNSDSDIILDIAKNFNVDVIKRKKELATDKIKISEVIKSTSKLYKNHYDIIIITSTYKPYKERINYYKCFEGIY